MLSEAKHLAPRVEQNVFSNGAPASSLRARTSASAAFDGLCRRVARCTACASMRHVHVLSEANGPLDAAVLFVAEAPGRLGAARTGVPMTSDVTGRRFEAFLAAAGLRRDRVFVTNAVLCNPLTPCGLNRRPSARDLAACRGFLAEQLRIVRVPIVVALGAVALEALRAIEPHGAKLRRDVAQPRPWAGRTLLPLYHPSVQSTLHRPHEQQLDDWRDLGALISGRTHVGSVALGAR